MSDLINRKIAVQGVRELFSMGDCYCDESSIVGMLNSLPSVEPEQKNQKTALSVQVKVDFDDMKALLEDIKDILMKHIKVKEVQNNFP